MNFTTRTSVQTTPNPHFLHKIEVLGENENIVASANAWTNLPSETHPHGYTQIMQLNTSDPVHSKLLHNTLATKLTELGFSADHQMLFFVQ